MDAAHAKNNLFLTAIHDAPSDQRHVVLDSISLLVFEEEIPPDRISSLTSTSSPDRQYSVIINANELKDTRYYVSVLCGQDDANFGIFAEFEQAGLLFGSNETGHICRSETMCVGGVC